MTLKVLSVVGNVAVCEGDKRVSYPVNAAKPKAGEAIEAFDHAGTLRPTDKQLAGKEPKQEPKK